MGSTEANDETIAAVVSGLALSGYARDFALMELGRGLAYHRARIAMLGLSGDTVLDAGCGVGNWSLPLAERYAHVEALEYSQDRLAVVDALARQLGLDTIRCVRGSIEALPYADGVVDAVFCNGVVFLTDVETSLSEFSRVLAPGGLLYVTYNTNGWWRFLIHVRGPKEPNVRAFGLASFEDRARRIATRVGANGLLSGADRAAVAREWDERFGSGATLRGRLSTLLGLSSNAGRMRLALTPPSGQAPGPAATALSEATIKAMARSHGSADIADLLDCMAEIGRSDGPRHASLILDLARFVWLDQPLTLPSGVGRCMEPDEVASLLIRLGLEVVASGSEGTILLDPTATPVAPIYAPEQGVWEMVARKSR